MPYDLTDEELGIDIKEAEIGVFVCIVLVVHWEVGNGGKCNECASAVVDIAEKDCAFVPVIIT